MSVSGSSDDSYDSHDSHDSYDSSFSDSAPTTPRSTSAVGVLPDKERFTVPETFDVMDALITPRSWKSPAVQLWLFLGTVTTLTPYLYYQWPDVFPRWLFIAQFIFWRLAYNVGLGYALWRQSNGGSFLAFFREHVKPNSQLLKLQEASVVFKDDTIPYSVSKFPDEFNAWLLFRFLVMIILANDLMSYFVCVLLYWEIPTFGVITAIRYAIGIGFIIFAVWSKADAHRVIGDYAWYWGDFFFLLDKSLVFDGIFQMFPHPMYSVGYAFMYGFSIMSTSHTIFYVSLFGHMCQLAFLVLVENPHIDKTYNALAEPTEHAKRIAETLYDSGDNEDGDQKFYSREGFGIYKKLQSNEFLLAPLLAYALYCGIWGNLPLHFHVAHCLLWRLFHDLGLGIILKKQSQNDWYTKQFHSAQEAFSNWRRLYNTVTIMTYVSFMICCYNMLKGLSPEFSTINLRVLVAVIGLVLVVGQVYVTTSVFEAIGDFGFYYGDFFVAEAPPTLTYSGIYRYLNNPDSVLGFCGYYGLVLLSGNIYALPLAIVSHSSAKLFELLVEKPHIKNKYGPSVVRPAGGLSSEVRKKTASLKNKVKAKKADYERLRQKYETFVNSKRRTKKKSE